MSRILQLEALEEDKTQNKEDRKVEVGERPAVGVGE